MSSRRRILLIGEGHGFISAWAGLVGSDYELFVRTESQLDNMPKANLVVSSLPISSWIESTEDIVLSASYRYQIDEQLLTKADFINIHYAKFPKYRGMHSIVWAILNGESRIAVTFHQMTRFLDAGPIFKQFELNVDQKTSWELMLECDLIVKTKINQTLLEYISGKLKLNPQDESEATFVSRRNREDCRVNWSTWDALYFKRALQALVAPYPLPFFEFCGISYEIVEAEVEIKNYSETPGKIVYHTDNFIKVKIIGGLINISKVRSESKDYSATELFPWNGTRLN
jgi:methionyl-tRNA formyltransferase